jgi:hypothetical protein
MAEKPPVNPDIREKLRAAGVDVDAMDADEWAKAQTASEKMGKAKGKSDTSAKVRKQAKVEAEARGNAPALSPNIPASELEVDNDTVGRINQNLDAATRSPGKRPSGKRPAELGKPLPKPVRPRMKRAQVFSNPDDAAYAETNPDGTQDHFQALNNMGSRLAQAIDAYHARATTDQKGNFERLRSILADGHFHVAAAQGAENKGARTSGMYVENPTRQNVTQENGSVTAESGLGNLNTAQQLMAKEPKAWAANTAYTPQLFGQTATNAAEHLTQAANHFGYVSEQLKALTKHDSNTPSLAGQENPTKTWDDIARTATHPDGRVENQSYGHRAREIARDYAATAETRGVSKPSDSFSVVEAGVAPLTRVFETGGTNTYRLIGPETPEGKVPTATFRATDEYPMPTPKSTQGRLFPGSDEAQRGMRELAARSQQSRFEEVLADRRARNAKSPQWGSAATIPGLNGPGHSSVPFDELGRADAENQAAIAKLQGSGFFGAEKPAVSGSTPLGPERSVIRPIGEAQLQRGKAAGAYAAARRASEQADYESSASRWNAPIKTAQGGGGADVNFYRTPTVQLSARGSYGPKLQELRTTKGPEIMDEETGKGTGKYSRITKLHEEFFSPKARAEQADFNRKRGVNTINENASKVDIPSKSFGLARFTTDTENAKDENGNEIKFYSTRPMIDDRTQILNTHRLYDRETNAPVLDKEGNHKVAYSITPFTPATKDEEAGYAAALAAHKHYSANNGKAPGARTTAKKDPVAYLKANGQKVPSTMEEAMRFDPRSKAAPVPTSGAGDSSRARAFPEEKAPNVKGFNEPIQPEPTFER